MAKQYKTRHSSKRRGSASQQFLVITVTFLLGYLAASFFDFETVSHWLNTQILAHQEEKPALTKPQNQQAQIPPKPKFEFYTLLANEKGPSQPHLGSNAPVNSVTTKPSSVAPAVAITNAAQHPIKGNALSSKPDIHPKLAEGKPLAPTSTPIHKSSYLVQVASFKARADAEHLKGMLILKGFDVNVVPFSHAGGNWYRVVVGPYANPELAQQAKATLAEKERLKGMITRL